MLPVEAERAPLAMLGPRLSTNDVAPATAVNTFPDRVGDITIVARLTVASALHSNCRPAIAVPSAARIVDAPVVPAAISSDTGRSDSGPRAKSAAALDGTNCDGSTGPAGPVGPASP